MTSTKSRRKGGGSGGGGSTESVRDIEDLVGVGHVEVNPVTCIGAGPCRTLAPTIFKEAHPHPSHPFSKAVKPVETTEEFNNVRRAVFTCPTKAIKWTKRPKLKSKEPPLWSGYPQLIEDNVYLCGWLSKKTFGAKSYLIVRGEGGNVLVDCPEPSQQLIDHIHSLGGVRYLFITHKDHAQHHSQWKDATGCTRIIHQDDVVRRKKTKNDDDELFEPTDGCEVLYQGTVPSALDGQSDLHIIPIPGHTKGSMALLYNDKFLFSGDSLGWSESQGSLVCFRMVCWYDWRVHTESVASLAEQWCNDRHPFVWVLPGHEDAYRARNHNEMRRQLGRCLEDMKRLPDGKSSIWRWVMSTKLRSKYGSWLGAQVLPAELASLYAAQFGKRIMWERMMLVLLLLVVVVLAFLFYF